ncbi:MAG: SDR family oxidoreductase [Candidatus Zixiibacteriota bacterium]|nr:MAG: SDR family oxidoreductase [candidate division Zixibacteria bacterium]
MRFCKPRKKQPEPLVASFHPLPSFGVKEIRIVRVKRLFGKTALITGAGRGIGRATASMFAEQGADLLLIARTALQLEETAAFCKTINNDVSVLSVPTDLADLRQIDRLFELIDEQGMTVDILINNAAVFASGRSSEFPIDRFQHLLDINLLAPYYLCQNSMPMMDKKRWGTIVNVSSLSGCFGTAKFPGFGAYNISKYGLWGLTEILALENKGRNIRVNQISLSGVDTQMFKEAAPPGVTPDLTPEQVAGEVLYFASDESAPITGGNLILDGKSRRWQSDD